MNKFKQVSNNDYQMLVVGARGVGILVLCPREWVQCIMGDGHMGPPCGQRDVCENITFLQLCLQVVNILMP